MSQAFHNIPRIDEARADVVNPRKTCHQFLSKWGEECFKSFFDDPLTSERFFFLSGGKMR